MSTGMMNEVAIIGMGCTCFGGLVDQSWTDLAANAFREACEDAGIGEKDIDACYFNNHHDAIDSAGSEMVLKTILNLSDESVQKAITFLETEKNAFHTAYYAVASGRYDIALALGVSKQNDIKDTEWNNAARPLDIEKIVQMMDVNTIFQCAMKAKEYFERIGISVKDGRKAVARVSFKNYRNGLFNPKSRLLHDFDMDEIINAPIVHWPIGLLDCSLNSNGSAAALLCRADKADLYRKDPIHIMALETLSVSDEMPVLLNPHNLHSNVTRRAAIQAYKKAGIKNPREEIGILETHDYCSMAELMHCEDLMISSYGKVLEDMDSGFYDQDGKIPSQTDGGFKSFGDAKGASEIRMVYETYKQLQGNADQGRQVKNAKTGLVHHLGGSPFMNAATIAILSQWDYGLRVEN